MKKDTINQKCFLIASLLCLLITLPFNDANAIGLKENSILTEDTITLGDIFYDLKRNEDRILGTAPQPGKDMVLNSRTLLRIALALDLSWRPTSPSDHIVLTRQATIIEYNQIEEALYTALYDEGIYGDYELTIPSQYHKITLPYDQPAEMMITKFSIDADRKKFTAMIVAPSAENPIQQFQFKGQLHSVISVPVLVDNLQRGHVITKSDITQVKIKEHEFTRDIVADRKALIGMTARRMIIAGRPIKDTEIIAPQIIARGSLVTLSFQDDILNLSTQVKALENGAKGDVIRVMNTASNKTLQAIVIAENEVAIVQN